MGSRSDGETAAPAPDRVPEAADDDRVARMFLVDSGLPESLRTYCNAEARTSSSVAGGTK